jgi:hypothetical protein
MTAMSAQSASQTPSNVARTVLLPGSPATFANRAFLKGLGLRWDPEGHRWHGTTSAENVRALREQLGLEARCFGSLDVSPKTEVAPRRPPATRPVPSGSTLRPQAPSPAHDGSRTHVEARVAIPAEPNPEEGFETPTRRFALAEITSGLPDDSREEDERREAGRLRDLRGRVKHARAVAATTPGLTETLANDWRRAARFYERFGITEAMFRYGVAGIEFEGDQASLPGTPCLQVAERTTVLP